MRYQINPRPNEEEIKEKWVSRGYEDFIDVLAHNPHSWKRTDETSLGYQHWWNDEAYVWQSEIAALQGHYDEGWTKADAAYQSNRALFCLQELLKKMEDADEWWGESFDVPRQLVTLAMESIQKQGG